MAFWPLTIEGARSASVVAAPVTISTTRAAGAHALVDCDSMVPDSLNRTVLDQPLAMRGILANERPQSDVHLRSADRSYFARPKTSRTSVRVGHCRTLSSLPACHSESASHQHAVITICHLRLGSLVSAARSW